MELLLSGCLFHFLSIQPLSHRRKAVRTDKALLCKPQQISMHISGLRYTIECMQKACSLNFESLINPLLLRVLCLHFPAAVVYSSCGLFPVDILVTMKAQHAIGMQLPEIFSLCQLLIQQLRLIAAYTGWQ